MSLPEDVVAYCECQKAADQGDFETALNHIKKAFEAKCDEVKYANAYFAVRLRLGDKSAIEEELTFFRQDIDCLVHSWRVYEWLKYLSSIKDYPGLRMTVRQIDEQLEALIAGQAQGRRQSPQRVEFYAHEKGTIREEDGPLAKTNRSGVGKATVSKEDPELSGREIVNKSVRGHG